jgi:hypothetical protein
MWYSIATKSLSIDEWQNLNWRKQGNALIQHRGRQD